MRENAAGERNLLYRHKVIGVLVDSPHLSRIPQITSLLLKNAAASRSPSVKIG